MLVLGEFVLVFINCGLVLSERPRSNICPYIFELISLPIGDDCYKMLLLIA